MLMMLLTPNLTKARFGLPVSNCSSSLSLFQVARIQKIRDIIQALGKRNSLQLGQGEEGPGRGSGTKHFGDGRRAGLKSLLSKKQTEASLPEEHSISLFFFLSLSPTFPSPFLSPSLILLSGPRQKGQAKWVLTFFSILRAAGESGVKRIFPISRGFAALQAILDRGLDSRLWINALQKVAARREGTDFIETPIAQD